MRRALTGLYALVAYMAQIAVVVTLVSVKAGFAIVAWLNDEDQKWILRGLAILALALTTWVFWDEVSWFFRYGWDHDRVNLAKSAFVLVKGVAVLAVAIAVLLSIVAVVIAIAAVPPIALVNVVVAWGRGLRVAVLAAKTPKVKQASPDAPPSGSTPILFQVSDLHIAAPGREPFEIEVEPAHWTNTTRPTSERLCARLQRILNAASQTAADAPIVITGDITDTGEDEEWRIAVECLEPFTDRLMLAPGNHDIAINRTTAPDFTQDKRRARELRYWTATESFRTGDDLGYRAGFPQRRKLARGATLFVLDSNRYPSRYVLSNAVGLHGEDQLARLETMLATTTGPVAVATHHHPVRHSGERFSFEDIYMVAIDGRDLLSILVAYRKRAPENTVLVLHGHRHLSMFGNHEGILIYGHPSSTLGQSSGGTLDCAGRYASVHLGPSNEWFVIPHKVEGTLDGHP